MFELDPQLERDCFFTADLPLCRLLLLNDANYPWYILVPRVADARELYQLTLEDQQQYLYESSKLAGLMQAQFQADKMNIAALGNVVSQLHIHHIARFESDACWPKPVWGSIPAKHYAEAKAELIMEETRERLKQAGLLL